MKNLFVKKLGETSFGQALTSLVVYHETFITDEVFAHRLEIVDECVDGHEALKN